MSPITLTPHSRESFPEWSPTRASLNTYLRAVDVFAYTGWILSEVLVVGITLAATHHHKALAGAVGRGRRTLSTVLFQDGACTAERVTVDTHSNMFMLNPGHLPGYFPDTGLVFFVYAPLSLMLCLEL